MSTKTDERTMPHPNESNPFGMLALTGWPDNVEFYIRPNAIVSIERVPAYTTEKGTVQSERTKLRISDYAHSGQSMLRGTPDIVLVFESPSEIFERKNYLDKKIGK